MTELNLDIQQSYYEYIVKLEVGCQQIATDLRVGKSEEAFQQIINFTEGISWLLNAEAHMKAEGYIINSRVQEATAFLQEINEALEIGDIITVADLFEYEISPIFSSAVEWQFNQQ